MKLLDKGIIGKKDKVVCELTGTGPKSRKEYERMVPHPHLVGPNLESLTIALQT